MLQSSLRMIQLLMRRSLDGDAFHEGKYLGSFRLLAYFFSLPFPLQDAMGHAIGDLNNDGYLEWFSSAIFDNSTNCEVSGCMFGNKGNKLYQNLGNRRFSEISTKVGYITIVNGF